MEIEHARTGPVARSKIVGLGFIVAAVATAMVLVGFAALALGGTAQESAIRAVATGGIDSLNSATIVGTKGQDASEISDAAMEQRRTQLQSIFAQWFTGDPLAYYSTSTQAAMTDQIRGGRRDVDGGASVDITSLTITGSQATVQARALIRLQSRSEGTVDYTLHLVATKDGWRIDTLTSDPEDPADRP